MNDSVEQPNDLHRKADNAINWQPLVEAVAPRMGELVDRFFGTLQAGAKYNLWQESAVIAVAAGVIGVVGAVAILAVIAGHYDTAERIAIPLISFVGGFGLGRLRPPAARS